METNRAGGFGPTIRGGLAAGRLLAIRELVREPGFHEEAGTGRDFDDLLAIGGLRSGLLRCLDYEETVKAEPEGSSQAA